MEVKSKNTKDRIAGWRGLLRMELLGIAFLAGALWLGFSLIYTCDIARQHWGWTGAGIAFFIWCIPVFFGAAFIGSPGPATPEAKRSDKLGIIIFLSGSAFIVALAAILNFILS